MTIRMEDNDGRKIEGYLPTFEFYKDERPVVQVVDESTGEILYTRRVSGKSFQPPVYHSGSYTVKIGANKPDCITYSNLTSAAKSEHKNSFRPILEHK